MKLPGFKGFLLGGLIAISIVFPGVALAAVVFDQSPTDLTGQTLSSPILNNGYLTSFSCTASLNCGVSGQTIYNIGVWIKKVGNPDDIMLQVGGSYNDAPIATTTVSNTVFSNTISDTEYTLKWFYFPQGVIIGNQYDFDQFFFLRYASGPKLDSDIDYYRVLKSNANDYSAQMQWCRKFEGCYSSPFFWQMDGSNVDLSTTTPVVPTGNSSVMFFPGVMSSRLYEELGSIDCGTSVVGNECFRDSELWVSASDANHQKLSLNTFGKSVYPVYTKDDTQSINDEAETGVIDESSGLNVYNSFINSLRNWKQDGTIPDYAFIPYDWRLSLNDIITNGASTTRNKLEFSNTQNFSESYILRKLQELQKKSGTGKVTLIGHSNGGLVIKALVQKLKDTNNPLYNQIDKIILVAVPQVGTPDAIVMLLHGKPLGKGLIMNNARARDISKNMPAIYNLLPSAGYFTTVDPAYAVDKVVSFENHNFFNPQTSQYGLFVSDNTELTNYILGTDGRTSPTYSDIANPNIGNAGLYSNAQDVHAILDSWQPATTTKVVQIAGWGVETIAGLDYISLRDTTEHISYKPRYVVDGDGTVVVPSALWMSTSAPNVERWWVDLFEYDTFLNLERVHRDILEIPNLISLIKSRITSIDFIDLENIVVNNTSSLNFTETRLHYTLHSPLTLGITDSLGRYTGLDPVTGQVREEIPGVTYEQIGEVQFLSVPNDISLTLKMQGVATGSFALDIDKQEGNTITDKTSFQGIPSTVSTKVEMSIVPNGTVASSTLRIDQNGDGIVDKTLQATPNSITVYDTTPPELQVTFSTSTKDVVLTAIDTLDLNPRIFTTSTSTTLTDNQGNTTIIPFTKHRESSTRFRFTYSKIVRNGVTTNLPNTNIIYDWQEKKDVLNDLDTRVYVKGVEKYVFNYRKANNNTVNKEKVGNKVTTTTKSGFVVVTIKTEGDLLKVSH